MQSRSQGGVAASSAMPFGCKHLGAGCAETGHRGL